MLPSTSLPSALSSLPSLPAPGSWASRSCWCSAPGSSLPMLPSASPIPQSPGLQAPVSLYWLGLWRFQVHGRVVVAAAGARLSALLVVAVFVFLLLFLVLLVLVCAGLARFCLHPRLAPAALRAALLVTELARNQNTCSNMSYYTTKLPAGLIQKIRQSDRAALLVTELTRNQNACSKYVLLHD